MSSEEPNKWWLDWPERKAKIKQKEFARQKHLKAKASTDAWKQAHQPTKGLTNFAERHKKFMALHTHGKLKEDVPTNSMGTSSSTSGPIQTYDPMLGTKKRIRDMWRRILKKR